MENNTKDLLLRNLRDAGCDEDECNAFIEQDAISQMKLLKKKRKELVEKLQLSQTQIDSLDYLLNAMKKESR